MRAAAGDLSIQTNLAPSNLKPRDGSYQVRREAETAQVADAGLSWLSLQLAVDGGHERNVDESKVLRSNAELELTQSLDERCRFDVSDGSTEL